MEHSSVAADTQKKHDGEHNKQQRLNRTTDRPQIAKKPFKKQHFRDGSVDIISVSI
jgi:hypothetical protein